jgi:hypothetical protein
MVVNTTFAKATAVNQGGIQFNQRFYFDERRFWQAMMRAVNFS